MSIRIFPKTGADHIGIETDEGRSYVIDLSQGPRLEKLAAGVRSDPSLVDGRPFVRTHDDLPVTSVGPDQDEHGFAVFVNGMPHDLTLTPVEVATLADYMIIRSSGGRLNSR